MSLAQTIARNTVVQIAGEVVSKLATLAFYVVMARALGRGGFGDFTFSLALAVLLTTFAGMGIDAIVAREIARERRTVHDLFWNAMAMKVGLCTVAVALAAAVAAIGHYPTHVQVTVVVLGIASSVEVISKTVYATFQGMDDMRPVAGARLLQRLVTAFVGIGALLAGAGVVPVAFVYLGGALVALAWAARRLAARGVRPRRRLSRSRGTRLAIEAIPVGLSAALGMVLFRIDATILSFIKGNDVVGLYGAPYRLLDGTLFFSFYFVAAMLPSLSRLDRRTSPTVGRAYESAAKVLIAVLAPVSVAFIAFAEPLIRTFFGAEYEEGITALRLLGGTAVLYPISYLSGYLLVAQGRQRVTPWVTGAVTVQNIALNLIFIPRYSLNAAAAITTLSQGTLALAMTALALRSTGALSLPRVVIGPAIGCAGMAAVAAAAGTGLAGLGGALAVYAVLLLAFERAVYPDDVRLLLRSLRGRAVATAEPEVPSTPLSAAAPAVASDVGPER